MTDLGTSELQGRLAAEMLDACRRDGHAARRVASDRDADEIRGALRRLSRHTDLRIRTARIHDTVAVVRMDADIWRDDGPTMRAKLRPPD